MKYKWVIWVVISGMSVALLLGIMVTRMLVTPFFVDENKGIGGMHTRVFNFQPYYLWSYEKQGGVYIQVFYLTQAKMPAVASLWLAGEYAGNKLDPVMLARKDKTTVNLASVADVRSNLGFGERLNVEYLTGEVEDILGAKYDESICETVPRICQVNDFVRARMDKYQRFSMTGRLAWSDPLPVLILKTELKK